MFIILPNSLQNSFLSFVVLSGYNFSVPDFKHWNAFVFLILYHQSLANSDILEFCGVFFFFFVTER